MKIILKCEDSKVNSSCVRFAQDVPTNVAIKEFIRNFVISRVSAVGKFINNLKVTVTLKMNHRTESTELVDIRKDLVAWLNKIFPYGESTLTVGDFLRAFKNMPKNTPVYVGHAITESGKSLGSCVIAESEKKVSLINSKGTISSKVSTPMASTIYGRRWTIDCDGKPVRIYGYSE